jgi:hypothetical protein
MSKTDGIALGPEDDRADQGDENQAANHPRE